MVWDFLCWSETNDTLVLPPPSNQYQEEHFVNNEIWQNWKFKSEILKLQNTTLKCLPSTVCCHVMFCCRQKREERTNKCKRIQKFQLKNIEDSVFPPGLQSELASVSARHLGSEEFLLKKIGWHFCEGISCGIILKSSIWFLVLSGVSQPEASVLIENFSLLERLKADGWFTWRIMRLGNLEREIN